MGKLHTVDFKGFYKTCSWTMGIMGNTEKSPPLLVSELAWPDPQEPNNLEPSYQETEMLGWVFNTICSRFYQHDAKKKMKNLACCGTRCWTSKSTSADLDSRFQ